MPDTDNGKITLALLGQQQQHIIEQLNALMNSFDELSRASLAREKAITKLEVCLREFPQVKERVDTMWPWVNGLKWAAMIGGGILIVALAAGMLWSMAQSGALIP